MVQDRVLVVTAVTRDGPAACTGCGQASRWVHSSHLRHLLAAPPVQPATRPALFGHRIRRPAQTRGVQRCETGRLDQPGPGCRPALPQLLRHRPRAGTGCRRSRPDPALPQQPHRGRQWPDQAAQTANLRPSRLPAPTPPHPAQLKQPPVTLPTATKILEKQKQAQTPYSRRLPAGPARASCGSLTPGPAGGVFPGSARRFPGVQCVGGLRAVSILQAGDYSDSVFGTEHRRIGLLGNPLAFAVALEGGG